MSTRLEQLGMDKKEVTQNVKVMSKEDITKSIEQLDQMPLEQFNKLILHKPETVIEKKIEIVDVNDCNAKDCELVKIEFKLLFNYIIGGYMVNRYFFTMSDFEKNKINNDLPMQDTTLKRKGGVFLLKVNYNHHTTFCGSTFISSTITRTPHSLMIPNYDLLVERHMSPEQIFALIEKVKKTQDNWEINLADLEEVIKEFYIKGCEMDHSEDYCVYQDCEDIDYCDEPHYETDTEYCENNCSLPAETNELAFFLTHPHFFNEMGNFCTGNQFSTNKTLVALQKYPNPITYIAEMIRICNDVNFSDSYYSDRYMTDVFDNWSAFNHYDRSLHRMREVGIYHNKQSNGTIFPSEYHSLSLKCFCMDCLIFRMYLANGLKFDPSKLLMADIGEVTLKTLKKNLTYFVKRDNMSDTEKQYILDIADIDMMNDKYHISNKSPFDNKNSGFAQTSFYMGLFTNKGTENLELVYSVNVKSNYDRYNSFINIKNIISQMQERVFSKEQYQKIQSILPTINEGIKILDSKTLMQYFDMIYEQVHF